VGKGREVRRKTLPTSKRGKRQPVRVFWVAYFLNTPLPWNGYLVKTPRAREQ
jgi:hypothetical protein